MRTLSDSNPYATCPVTDAGELGALYDNNALPRNQSDLRALQSASAAAHAAAGDRVREQRHGPLPWQSFDLFLPQQAPRAALLFVHGGRWTLNTSRETAFWAQACVRSGAAFIGLNFQPLQQGGLAAQIDSVVEAVSHALAWAREAGLASDAVCLGGHSSGAHLALAALLAPAAAGQPPLARCVARLLLLGGMYDLAPLQRTVHQQALDFSDEDVLQRSPLRRLASGAAITLPRTLVAVGAQETPEFLRQARALHWSLQWQHQVLWHEIPAAGHFDAALEFNTDDSVLRRFALPHAS